jgi:hypothetical protein
MQPRYRRQADLFKEHRKLTEIPDTERMTLVRLIECLLLEAITGSDIKAGAANHETTEATHEQDHA